jgi:hypothetical protein
MAIAIAWATAKSAEATEEEYDENDQEYQTYRHRKSLHVCAEFVMKEFCLSKLGNRQLSEDRSDQSPLHVINEFIGVQTSRDV